MTACWMRLLDLERSVLWVESQNFGTRRDQRGEARSNTFTHNCAVCKINYIARTWVWICRRSNSWSRFWTKYRNRIRR